MDTKGLMILVLMVSALRLTGQSRDSVQVQDMSWVGPAIELINSYVNSDESKSQVWIDTKANDKRGRLTKRYNRWFKRGKITAYQFDALCSDLYRLPMSDIRVLRMSSYE